MCCVISRRLFQSSSVSPPQTSGGRAPVELFIRQSIEATRAPDSGGPETTQPLIILSQGAELIRDAHVKHLANETDLLPAILHALTYQGVKSDQKFPGNFRVHF